MGDLFMLDILHVYAGQSKYRVLKSLIATTRLTTLDLRAWLRHSDVRLRLSDSIAHRLHWCILEVNLVVDIVACIRPHSRRSKRTTVLRWEEEVLADAVGRAPKNCVLEVW